MTTTVAGSAAASLPLHNVFVYGSLLADEVVNALLKRMPPCSPAILNGYHRYSIKGRVYPAILPVESKKVIGRVIKGVTDAELHVLDAFEDEEYKRSTVEVFLNVSIKSFLDIEMHWFFLMAVINIMALIEKELNKCWNLPDERYGAGKLVKICGQQSRKVWAAKERLLGAGQQAWGCRNPLDSNGTSAEHSGQQAGTSRTAIRRAGTARQQGDSEELFAETYVWADKDDPKLYGEWDFEQIEGLKY
ncbi:hypothetical protein M5K25_006162 [Dendrobium thyrsiflorum]|uniref:Putative gamma-glutamylcyclotransferase n=1 Tax=Dendrobium thyrsiflorum TaxID=117978 RepID=A0ABD0VC75_DENTH